MTEERAEADDRDALRGLLDRLEPVEAAGGPLDGRVVVFARTRERVVTIVELLTERGGPPTTLVVDADATPILSRQGWFEVTTRASDLVADGTLAIRETQLPAETPTAVGNDRIAVLATLFDATVELSRPLERRLREGADELVERAAVYDPPLPGVRAITDRLETEFDPRVAADFADAVDTVTRSGNDIDGLLLLLIVGAIHRLRWKTIRDTAAELGLATANPLRERKTTLLDRGLLRERPDTEYDGPGRPPNILCLPDRLDVGPEDGVHNSLFRRVVASE